MPNNTNDSENYDVGYKKPPKNTRFNKGQSGNPKGRPKGSINVKTALDSALKQNIQITERGSTRTVTIMEGIVIRLASDALKGDIRAARILIDKWISLCPDLLVRPEVPELRLTLRTKPSECRKCSSNSTKTKDSDTKATDE